MSHLSGKTAVITGASRGIGAATARYFADHGAKVVLLARSAPALDALADEIRSAGGEALAVVADVSRYDDVAAAIKKARDTFGSVDILVNNAGGIDPIARIADSDPAAWGQAVDVNLKGAYHALRAALSVMGDGSVVVNMSSGAATSALEGWSHYCATKAALLSLTRCAHREVGGDGIRVVGLSPGTVATDMQRAIRASGINPVSKLPPSAHISPEWVAKAVAWLCGPEGAEFAGTDFSLKNDEGRQRVGLPSITK